MNIASYIDHTCLKPDTTITDIETRCMETMFHKFRSLCIPPVFVPHAVGMTSHAPITVCTVIGFPLGTELMEIKIAQAEAACEAGAKELDMVMSIGGLKGKDFGYVKEEIQEILKVARSNDALLKVIVETCLLSDKEKKKACEMVVKVGADFVKTSTGFASGGATVEDVQLLASLTQGSQTKVKASGGIRTYDQAMAMIEAGAERIGTSTGLTILAEAPRGSLN